MGAGQQDDHFIQDGAELYWVYKVQHLLTTHNYNLSCATDEKEKGFKDHIIKRNITDKFYKSMYCKNVDKHVNHFVELLIHKYDRKVDCISVEVEYRNKSKKGDFIIKFDANTTISYSLKNYKKDFKTIQVCSGTWPSFCNKFILTDSNGKGNIGPGMYLDTNQKKFRGSNKFKRNKHIIESQPSMASEIIAIMDKLNDMNTLIRTKYLNCDKCKCWTTEVADMWKHDCREFGIIGANYVNDIINMVDDSKKKQIILTMCGLNNDAEELLCIDKDNMMCSSFNEKWSELLHGVNDPLTTCMIKADGPKLNIELVNNETSIMSITIPFTLQKNGAWFLNEEYKTTGYYHPKEKKHLNYGDRRPKKCRELSTSINTFFSLKSCGLY